jgi:hypothetical protein
MKRPRLLILSALALLQPFHAASAGRCAYVEVGAFDMTEPKQQCFSLDMTCAAGDRYGCFKVPLELKSGWIDGGERGKLRELSAPFGYIDPDGVHWDVPAGYQTDGASIPIFFQPIIGGPWTDSYVKAAVLHDFYIRRTTARPEAVHKLFYLALLAAGNSHRRAEEMFFAVSKFGPQWKHVDVAAFEEAWRARKAMLDRVTKRHQDVWDAFQASERKREQQAAIDRAVLGRPLRERTHIFTLSDSADLDAFIDEAIRDHIVDPDRDATLIDKLREQVETEQQRPAEARNNIFLLQFTKLGATIVSFSARNEVELQAQLKQTDQLTHAQEEQPDLPPAICVGECATRH